MASITSTSVDSNISQTTRETAFKQAIQIVDFNISNNISLNITEHLEKLRTKLRNEIEHLIKQHINIKIWLVQEVDYSPVSDPEALRHAYLRTTSITFLNSFQIDGHLNNFFEQIVNRNSNYIQGSSESVLRNIDKTSICAARFRPLAGGLYSQLPIFLQGKKCIINIQTTDERCFAYSVPRHFTPQTTITDI